MMYNRKSDIIAVMHIYPVADLKTPQTKPLIDNRNASTVVEESVHPSGSIHGVANTLTHLQHFHVKGELRIPRYPCHSFLAVREIRRDDDATLSARLHTCNANVPTFDD